MFHVCIDGRRPMTKINGIKIQSKHYGAIEVQGTPVFIIIKGINGGKTTYVGSTRRLTEKKGRYVQMVKKDNVIGVKLSGNT